MAGDAPLQKAASAGNGSAAALNKEAELPEFILEILEKQNFKTTESPRAYIVLIVAYIDDLLLKLLTKKLVTLQSNDDSLLSSYGPLYNLGPKIDLAYRMGLISRDLSWCLHQMRTMRDDCAHSHDKKGFGDSPIKEHISNIYAKMKGAKPTTKPEDKFQEISANILILLWSAINNATPIPEWPKDAFFA